MKIRDLRFRSKELARARARAVIATRVDGTDDNRYYASINDAYQIGGFSTNGVRACCKGQRGSFKGWAFRYATKEEKKQYEQKIKPVT